MSKPLVTDEWWSLVEPLLPRHKVSPKGGRPPKSDRLCLTGILYVLKTGMAWEDFPQEMGCCGMTLWNRLNAWRRAGVWRSLHALVLSKLHQANLIDWSRATADSASIRGARGKKTGPSPVDRRKNGSKHHLLTDARGTPLAVTLTGANRHDVTQLVPLVDAVPPVRGRWGRPLRRPAALYADRAYDSQAHRVELRRRGIIPHLARRGAAHGSGLGVVRYVAEQTQALLHQFKRLRTRYDVRDDIHESFLDLACSIICWRRLRRGFF